MPSRRDVLTTSAALGLTVALPAWADASKRPLAAESARLRGLMDAMLDEKLRRFPEQATSLGLDKAERGWMRAQLGDSSLSAYAGIKASDARNLATLRTIDRAKLTPAEQVTYDTLVFTISVDDEANRRFSYGGSAAGAPYILSQLTGAYQWVPDFLDSQHPLAAKEDADAYLSRLQAFATVMDQEVEVVRHDAGLGVIPPDFAIDKALTQLRAFLAYSPAEAPVVASLARRTQAAGLAGAWGAQAEALYAEKVRPAMERQLGLLETLRSRAAHDAGVWRLPDGEAYYAQSLTTYTTANILPDEVHRLGQDLVRSLSAETDNLMRKAGYTQGTVGERFQAMSKDPSQLFPNTDEGKAALIERLNEQVRVIAKKLPEWFGQLPKAPLEIRRVPPAIEAGAPGGYYNNPSLDGSRPGIYWINLRDTAETPAWTLQTLTYHEGLPGHHLQLALNNEAGDLPLLRKTLLFSGYSEGWGLYAEELAVEMGMYADDPLGHIGMLHDALFRAVRLVVDSGMHAKRWSREQALGVYMAELGDPEPAAATEIERYAVWPGQACSYMVGKMTWLNARARARKALGRRFDIRRFHDAGLLAGGTPLAVLDSVIDGYISAERRR